MPRRPTYPPEFRRRVLDRVRAGRSLSEASREFKIARQTIMNWLKQDDLDAGRRTDGLTTEERAEVVKLRRRVRELEMDNDILKKAAAWFARESKTIPEKSSDS